MSEGYGTVAGAGAGMLSASLQKTSDIFPSWMTRSPDPRPSTLRYVPEHSRQPPLWRRALPPDAPGSSYRQTLKQFRQANRGAASFDYHARQLSDPHRNDVMRHVAALSPESVRQVSPAPAERLRLFGMTTPLRNPIWNPQDANAFGVARQWQPPPEVLLRDVPENVPEDWAGRPREQRARWLRGASDETLRSNWDQLLRTTPESAAVPPQTAARLARTATGTAVAPPQTARRVAQQAAHAVARAR